MSIKKFRFIPHPDDLMEVNIKYDGIFETIDVFIDDGEDQNYDGISSIPFITQVEDRLTVQNSYIHVRGELVNSSWSSNIKENK